MLQCLDERLEAALGRFDHLIRGIDVAFSGARGADAHCRVLVALSGRGVLVVDEADADPFAAALHAVDRLHTAIRRRANRRAHRRRGRE